MFVIADVAWLNNSSGHFSMTQLSAIRVNKKWQSVSCFDAIVRPLDETFYNWENVAYKGSFPEDFLRARNAQQVLSDFEEWLKYDDVILWWDCVPCKKLKTTFEVVLKKSEDHEHIVVKEYVQEFFEDYIGKKIGLYKLAERIGVDVNKKLECCTCYDVEVLRRLMEKADYPQEALLLPLDSEETADGEIKTKPVFVLPYQYDSSTNTVHKRNCPEITDKSQTQGFMDIISVRKNGYDICDCCKEEYYKALTQRNKKIIEKRKWSFVYIPGSDLFHKSSCWVALRAESLENAGRYKTAISSGRIPCKICNPTDNCVSSTNNKKIKILKRIINDSLTKEDKDAIIRQKNASEERSRLLENSSLTESEIKDIYTLTQPRFAFWAGQGYANFHLRSCSKLQGISNLRGFSTYNEAISAGYTPCKKCRPTEKNDVVYSIPIQNQIRENDSVWNIEALCDAEGYLWSKNTAFFYLETPVGKWKIDIKSVPITLYHINLVITPGCTEYHTQPRKFLSFTDVFDYIKRHDTQLAQKKENGLVYVKYFESSY